VIAIQTHDGEDLLTNTGEALCITEVEPEPEPAADPSRTWIVPYPVCEWVVPAPQREWFVR